MMLRSIFYLLSSVDSKDKADTCLATHWAGFARVFIFEIINGKFTV